MKRFLTFILAIVMTFALFTGTASAAKKTKVKYVKLMTEGEAVDISAKLKGKDIESIDWTVTDPEVINAKGAVITALNPGIAAASAVLGKTSVSVRVVVLPEKVDLQKGDTYQLPFGKIESYKMKNTKTAKVNKKGVIYGANEGSTTLRVKYGRQAKYITVNVAGSADAVQQSKAAELECAKTAEQIVLVEYKSGSSASVSIHQKQDGIWKEIDSCNAYVGKNGIGKTKEGDKKTPSGTYNLTTPFGIKGDPGSKLPYLKVTKYHYWCGSSASQYYNQLVDTRETGTKCTSSDEYLINYKGVYNYCMFIDYNAAGVAGKGSCIFLHCKGSNKYTAGCIAVDESFMKKIIQWADAGCKIVIR